MSRVEVERLGGFAAYGARGSRLRSRGQVDSAELAPADRRAVEQLFDNPPSGGHMPDAFRYRLTRYVAAGAQSIEVGEQHVPAALRSVVQDELV